MVLITEKDISTTYNHFNMKQVETQLQDQEYELLKAFKEKNGLKTDYQGLKELVKALDIPEFHEEIKTEEKKEVKTEVKPIDRTNLENWVKDLGFEQNPKRKTLEKRLEILEKTLEKMLSEQGYDSYGMANVRRDPKFVSAFEKREKMKRQIE